MAGSDRNRVAFETARLELARLRVNTETGHEVALQSALKLCARTLKVERVGYWQFTDDRSALALVLGYELSSDDWSAGDVLPAARHPRYWRAVEARRIIAARDARTDPDTAELAATYLVPLGISSVLDAPVFRAGELAGVVCFEHVGAPRTWGPDEVSFASATGDLVAMVLEQAARLEAESALRVQSGLRIAADKLDLVESLCRGLAHDFANVLLAVDLVGEQLAQRGDGKLAESLHACAALGGNLVGQLRRFAARGENDPPRMPVRAVLERMVPVLTTLVRDSAELKVELDALPPDLESTLAPPQLEQIILNLCLNARDALVDRGTIEVTASLEPSTIELVVRDNGTGMDEDVLAHIWEPYFTTKRHGTGLGLATVKSIVDSVGATITVDSIVGTGTRFTLRLPRA